MGFTFQTAHNQHAGSEHISKPETETFIVDTSSVHDEVEPIVARPKGDSETA